MDHDKEDDDRNLIEPEGVDSEVSGDAPSGETRSDPGAPRPADPFASPSDNGSLLAAGEPDEVPQPGQELSAGEG